MTSKSDWLLVNNVNHIMHICALYIQIFHKIWYISLFHTLEKEHIVDTCIELCGA